MSSSRLVCRAALWLLFWSLLTSGWLTPAIIAQEPGAALQANTGLRFVPADASFYFSRLRMKQQYEAFVKSTAWTNLMNLPGVKMAADLAEAPPPIPELEDVGISELRQLLDQPENKELIQLLGELISHEAFIYGDVGFAETYELAQKMTEQANEDGLKDENKLSEEIIKILAKWKVPDLLIGFKITDAKQAENQLARLEELLKAQLEALPDWKERLSRKKVGAVEFITLQLNGSMIPWGEMEEDATEEAKKNAAKVREALETKTLVVSLGVVDGYILLSVGDTDEHLSKLGQGELLVDRPELAPLRKVSDKSFTNILYASERFLKSANNSSTQIDNYVTVIERMLPESGFDEETQKEIMGDVRGLAVDLKSLFPKAGAYLGFGFLSPRGTEGYSYDWSEQLSADGSKELSILNHLGGNPLAFYAWRSKYAPGWHEARAKWFGRLIYWSERYGLPEMPPEQLKIYEKLRADLLPLVMRLDAAIKSMWIPAFKDGQNAIVIDAKLTNVKWAEAMPVSTKPLPLPEVALVSGVSDAPLLKQAGSEFFDIAQRTADVLNTHFPEAVPKTQIPLPSIREFAEGAIYYYSPPPEAGVDPQIAPNVGLSKDTMALSYVPKFSLRLLQNKPLAIKEGPLARANQPLASTWHLDFAGCVDALGVWVDYGFEQSSATGLELDAETLKTSKEHAKASLDFLRCLRSITSVSYLEGGALVTHSEWNLVDQK